MIYAPEVLVRHSHSLTCRNFLKQHFNYGRGAFFFHLPVLGNGYERSGNGTLVFLFKFNARAI